MYKVILIKKRAPKMVVRFAEKKIYEKTDLRKK